MLHYSIIIWLNPVFFFCNILVSQWFLTPKDFPRKLLHSDMADHCSWWLSHYSMVLRNLEDTDTCSHKHHQHMCPHYSKVMQSGYTHLCWPHNGLLEDIFNNKQCILQPSLIMFLNNGFNKLRRLLMVQATLCLTAVWCEYTMRSRDMPPEKNVIILQIVLTITLPIG